MAEYTFQEIRLPLHEGDLVVAHGRKFVWHDNRLVPVPPSYFPFAGGGDPPPSVPGPPPPVSPPPPPPPPPPPAQPRVVATPPGARVASMWVEGSELHYIASNGVEYAETGSSIATPTDADPGSIWMESNTVRYIDASGIERQISRTAMPSVPATAKEGSIWLENSAPTPAGRQVQWIGAAATRFQWWNGF